MTNDFAKLLLPLSLSLGWLIPTLTPTPILTTTLTTTLTPKMSDTFSFSVRVAVIVVAVALYAAQFSKQSAVDVILPLSQPAKTNKPPAGASAVDRERAATREHHPVTFTAHPCC